MKKKSQTMIANNDTAAAHTSSRRSLGRQLLRTFGPNLLAHRRLLFAAYAFSLLAEALAVLSPWPLKIIIDHVLISAPLPTPLAKIFAHASPQMLTLALTLLLVVIVLGEAFAGAINRTLIAKVRERLGLDLRDRMLAHMQKLSLSIQATHRSGELAMRLVGDVTTFAKLQTKTLPDFFRHGVTCVLTLAFMFWLEPRLALLGVIMLPGFMLLVKHYNASLTKASRAKRKEEGNVAGLAQEIMRGLPTVQALGGETYVRKQFAQANMLSLAAGVNETRIEARIERTLKMAQGIATALILGSGGLMVLSGHLTVGTLTIFVAYIKKLLSPVEKINDLAFDLTRGLASAEQLFALLELPPAVQDAPNALELRRSRGVIELREVWFSYTGIAGQSSPVLRGANLRLEPGSLTALVGGSGNGKSTLLSLLLRLHEPTAGKILLDGRPLAAYTVRSLRDQIAVMLQHTHLFAGTVREALCAQHALPDHKLWEALEMVCLDEFVRGLPQQLDAELGEDGLNFSGGQRKRIALARAFLWDRPILLLDEPLANVDAASASVIMAALDRLRKGRTCLVITHETQVMDQADVVYHLEDGAVELIKAETPFFDESTSLRYDFAGNGANGRNALLTLPRNGMLL